MNTIFKTYHLYPGIELQDDVEALSGLLKQQGNSISAELRPALKRLIAKHRQAIDGHKARERLDSQGKP